MSPTDEPGERRGLLPRFTLKDGNTFLLADALGDIQGKDDGLFTNDTRMLSRFEFIIAGRRPSLLGAAIDQDNTLFTAHLTNRPLAALGELSIPQGVIHIERRRFLWDGRFYEHIRLTNFGEHDAEVPLQFLFAADFADIFEVQGHARKRRGEPLPPKVGERGVQLSYRGIDEVVRTTQIEFSMKPVATSPEQAEFHISLPRGENAEMFLEIGSEAAGLPTAKRFNIAQRDLSASMQQRLKLSASLGTPARLFNQWVDRSHSDLALLTTPLPTGPYPYAGIPWFATQFGRDAIITSLQTLWLNPHLAAGVLSFLASTQATEESAFRDSEPGKIMHEMRRGEMAALKEVPFGCYYGGVDTTPLFVMLAGAYETSSGDRTLVDRIWASLLAATDWIERRLDRSPTGFLDYARGERSGLVNQAWKDSHDSIFHADGSFPRGPVAVVEVQGYAYAALKAMAELAAKRGDEKRSA
ncbi:MAG: amylo-alpha-1,6-glucosidase, partial [Steroidobacteraceae bacterium]